MKSEPFPVCSSSLLAEERQSLKVSIVFLPKSNPLNILCAQLRVVASPRSREYLNCSNSVT